MGDLVPLAISETVEREPKSLNQVDEWTRLWRISCSSTAVLIVDSVNPARCPRCAFV